MVVKSGVRYRKGARWSALLTGALLVGLSTPAFAQADASSKAEAEALFAAARTLAAAGNYAEACPKFEASEKLDPGVGTMLNLAECYDKLGRTASAWAQYREALAHAHANHATDREEFARGRVQELAARLSTLTIRVSERSGGEGLTISRDGEPVDTAALGVAIPMDPGKHRVDATAPGHKPWSAEVVVGPSAANVTVDIPALDAWPATHAPAPTPPTAAPPIRENPPPAPERAASTRRPLAVGVAAGGAVALGVGVFFGLSAGSNWQEAKQDCASGLTECTPPAFEKRHRALTDATVSTVAFVAGGAAVALGAVLWFTAPSGTAVGVGPGSILAQGRF